MPKLIPDGPDIPAELIQKQEAGEMVLFCGAGISVPTGLPSFPRLVRDLYDSLNIRPDSSEEKMIERREFAEVLDHLEQRVTDNAMRSEVARILSSTPKPDSLRLHRALLQVSQTPSGVHLVTTNYDDNFARANGSRNLHVDAWPTLPDLDAWNSLVHLHGRIGASARIQSTSRLVLTDHDFGKAYFDDGWATKFVSDLIRRYTVVFIGYSMTDVVVRYLTKTLTRRQFGDRTYSLVGYKDEKQREERESAWNAISVHPMFYHSRNDHELLVQTVEEWSNLAADPHQYRIMLAVSGLKRPPDSKTHEADPSRVVWALSDPVACFPAVNRVRRTPVPGAYAAAWLHEFAARGLLGGTVQPKFHERGPAGPVVTVLAEQQMLQSDPVANAVAYWIEIHAHSPEVFQWVISHGRNIGFELRRRLWDRLTASEDDLPEIPPRLARLWSLLLVEPPEDAEFLLRLNRILNNLEKENTEATDDLLLRLLRPRLGVFPGPAPYRLLPPDDSKEQLALLSCGHTDVILGCRDERRQFNVLTRIEPGRFPDLLRRHGVALAEYLKTAFELLRRSDRPHTRSIYFELLDALASDAPGMGEIVGETSVVKQTIQQRRMSLSDLFGVWTVLLDWVRASYRALPEDSEERDGLLRYWVASNEKMLWCLALEAIERDSGADFELVRAVLGRNAQEMLWDTDCNRQVLSILRQVGTRASSELRTELLDTVQARVVAAATEPDTENTVLVAIGARLAALDEGGVVLSSAAAQALANFERWKRGAGSHESESSPAALNGRIREVAAALRSGSVDVAAFREFAERRPVAAVLALQDLGHCEDWPTEMWKVALDLVQTKVKDSKVGHHRTARLAEILQEMPAELFQCLQFEIARLVELLAERWPGANDSSFWRLWIRGWEYRSQQSSILSRVDALTQAINTTAGTYAAAAVKRIGDVISKTAGPITREQTSILDQISGDTSGSAGIVMLVFHLDWLYRNATDWTTRHILPRMRWGSATAPDESSEETRALWGVVAFRGSIMADLVRALGSDLWTAVQHHKEIDHGEKLVRFFVYVSASPQNGLIDDVTSRETARIVIPDSPLQVGIALCQVLEEHEQPAEQVWTRSVCPWLDRYWPREKALNNVESSWALVQVIMGTGDAFPEAVNWASGYLVASNEPNDRQIGEVWYHRDTWKSHPKATVALLHRIVPEANMQSWQRASLGEMLETLRELDATIPQDPKFVELERRSAG